MRRRVLQMLFCLSLGLVPAAIAAAEQCSADCTHRTKACVCAIDAEAGDLALVPIGGVDRLGVQLRQALDVGDEITSANESAVVGLTCPGGSDVKLHGRFRAVIMPAAEGQDCALNLLAGNADVLTERPTQLAAGETLMGSKRTLYGMRVSRDSERSSVECLVFDGEAEVLNLNRRTMLPLGSSTKASWLGGQLVGSVSRVSPRDVASATLLYARADLARARAQGVSIDNPESFQRALQKRYAAVLARPDDPAPRIELATLQTSAQLSRPALYHLEKAERLEPARTDQRATIAATKREAYKQIGRERDAAVESEKLRRLDPERYKTIERADPKVGRSVDQPRATDTVPASPAAVTTRPAARPRMVIAATAAPSSVSIGEPTTISVTVATGDDQPVAGAKVIVSAGGGLFRRTGRTQVEGVTDARGRFRTEWLCKPCAPGYRIGIEVTAAGFPPGNATVDVKTR